MSKHVSKQPILRDLIGNSRELLNMVNIPLVTTIKSTFIEMSQGGPTILRNSPM